MSLEILLLGGSGLLGSDLKIHLEHRGNNVAAPTRDELDLNDDLSIQSYFLFAKPDWIINCAAYTAVDKAETQEMEANYLNGAVPQILARNAKRLSARLLHVSTDFVFDGTKSEPYVETDPTNPLGVYGKSKLNGENLVFEYCDDSIVVRTAWLFGIHGNCFPKTILRAAQQGKPLRVVADQIGSPTFTQDLAAAIALLVENGSPTGIYHVVNHGQASWYEFASQVLGVAGCKTEVSAISTEEWPTPATRPRYTVLDSSKYESLGFSALPNWKDAVRRFVMALEERGLE